MTTAPTFASAREAAEVVRAGLGFLAAADATAMAAETQAQCLQILEQATAMSTAARASILAAFTTAQGYSADADYSPKAWLIHRTGITKGTAVAYTAWVRRAAAHPQVAQALAAGEISESVARTICTWTDKLPGDCRPPADAILLTAAKAGMDVRDLAELAGEIYARSLPGDPGKDQDQAFGDRSVKLETTFDGAGVLTGDLTPECASVVGAVLDALSAPAGAEDTRSQAQRYHDALHEAMQRLVTAGLLPERAGQPVKALVHISLADLMALDGSSALLEEWTAGPRPVGRAPGGRVGGRQRRRRVAGRRRRHRDGVRRGHGPGRDRRGEPRRLRRAGPAVRRAGPAPPPPRHRHRDGTGSGDGPDAGLDGGGGQGMPAGDTTRAWEALERAIIGKAVDLLSGPGGLASFLRRRQLGARLGGPSLPLDIGYSETIPASIRNAVILRDKHCQWAGKCSQPASACQVHHVKHKKNGGKTSVKDCVLLCLFHHQIVIHRWGWTLVLNPDGTTTAWNPDKTKVLHSHGPPARPG